jgi:hypothetical protein
MAAERLRKIKEEPLIDERIPHPYREVIRELRAIRAQLEEMKQRLPIAIPPPVVKIPPAPPAPGMPPITVKLPPIGEIEIGDASVGKLAELIAAKLIKLPNRVERIDIDTSNTTAVSLKKAGKIKPAVALGFEVEDVGGGFSYTIVRAGFGKDEKTAITGDKWDQELDDLLVKGSGNPGTARIWYFWRA